MPPPATSLPPTYRSLSGQLLVVTLTLVVVGSVIIHLLALGRHREALLHQQINHAYLVTLTLRATATIPDRTLTHRLLESIQAQGLEISQTDGSRPLVLGDVRVADLYLELPVNSPLVAIREAVYTLLAGGRRLLAVTGYPTQQAEVRVTLFLDERPLYQELLGYSRQTLAHTMGTALAAGLLVYLGLQWFLVRAIRRITINLVAFRHDPGNAEHIIQPSHRPDEIGVMERELARMQASLRESLNQQSRLATLGRAVSKINHDLRSILSTVSITSAQLAKVDNPGVHRVLPLLSESVERAIQLCTHTLDLARGNRQTPHLEPCELHELLEHVAKALIPATGVQWHNHVAADLTVLVDRERLYRLLFNLIQNAIEAMGEAGGSIQASATSQHPGVCIAIEDSGPGIPESIRESLFTPFTSARPGGTGLGLASARDLAQGHGGDLHLAHSSPQGSCFHLYLPNMPHPPSPQDGQ